LTVRGSLRGRGRRRRQAGSDGPNPPPPPPTRTREPETRAPEPLLSHPPTHCLTRTNGLYSTPSDSCATNKINHFQSLAEIFFSGSWLRSPKTRAETNQEAEICLIFSEPATRTYPQGVEIRHRAKTMKAVRGKIRRPTDTDPHPLPPPTTTYPQAQTHGLSPPGSRP